MAAAYDDCPDYSEEKHFIRLAASDCNVGAILLFMSSTLW
jgi:hypothetical protein